ncbi:MAG: acyltransferase [Acidimicrobiales bacterium]
MRENFIWRVSKSELWGQLIRQTFNKHPLIIGSELARLSIHSSAIVNDATLNIGSGRITIGEFAFFGHGVSLLTGTHDISKRGLERQGAVPDSGRDITIGCGVWLASGVVVIGPVSIGADAVVAAGSLVLHDVPPGAVVGGVPARLLRTLPPPDAAVT